MSNKLIVGCGYLGSRIAPLWRAQGHRIFATTRKPGRAEELARQGVEPILADVLDPASLSRLPAVDGVVYCVGMDRATGASMRQVYVEGLQNVLAALPGLPRLVYVSSTSVYGQTDGEEVDEEAVVQPLDEAGRIIREAERLLRPDAVVLRFAGMYGPGRLIRAAALKAGEPLAVDPDKWLNLIHVADGSRAVVAAEARGKAGGVYNICDDRPARRRAFYTRLAEVLHAPPPRFVPPPDPPPPHDRGNRRIVNRRMRQELELDLQYPSFEEGLPASL